MDHSIILKGWEVRAFLDKRKTLIARPMKPQPMPEPARIVPFGDGTFCCESNSGKIGIFSPHFYKCPFGFVGDRLIGKEAWCPQTNIFGGALEDRAPFYKADQDDLPTQHVWHSASTIPRWASRFLFDVLSVRAVRVQDVTDAEAHTLGLQQVVNEGQRDDGTTQGAFKVLWDSDFPKYPHESNPWVWLAEVRRA